MRPWLARLEGAKFLARVRDIRFYGLELMTVRTGAIVPSSCNEADVGRDYADAVNANPRRKSDPDPALQHCVGANSS